MRHGRQRGFTLLEMAVVLGIIALIVGFGLSLGDNALKSADRVEAQERLVTIQMALDNYAAAHGYLPCPYSRALVPANDVTFGVENRSGTTCTASGAGLVSVSSTFIGGVPVRTLGLPDSYAGDPWGNKYTYAVSASHVGSAVSYGATDPTLTVMMGDRTVAGTFYSISASTNRAISPSTSAAITPNTSGPTSTGAGATYVVVSHGPSGLGAFPMNGTAVVNACGTSNKIDVENCNDTNATFYDALYNDNGADAQFFDDYVVWASNALVRGPIVTTYAGCGVGVCEPWCAQCTGTLADVPVAASALTNPVLCQKVITNATSCNATCVWAGTVTAGGNIVRCP